MILGVLLLCRCFLYLAAQVLAANFVFSRLSEWTLFLDLFQQLVSIFGLLLVLFLLFLG